MMIKSSLLVSTTLFSTLTFFNLVTPALATSYSLADKIVGPAFFNAFEWQAIDDPTHGRVQYVDQPTARKLNLTYASSNRFILRGDYKTVVDPASPGRKSVRIRTKKTYRSHVAVFNINHMPQGCGTWPALWETKEAGWPNGGEIDILEGVNDQGPNAATLHTLPGCTMPRDQPGQTGVSGQLDCNWEVNGNTGCPVKFRQAESYGPAFNANRGGWYAVERTTSYIKIWFWPRNDPNVPAEVKGGLPQTNPNRWGAPVAYFPDQQCPIARLFQEHNIIINLTFCGDWAGGVYGQSGCPGNCIDHVNRNPAAFKKAYFDFASIYIYT